MCSPPFTPRHSPARNTAVFYLKRQKLPTSISRTSSAARLLTRDEARRIAANIAKLPANLPAPESGPGAGSPNVRFGSKADIAVRRIDVRFTPKSGHWLSASGCPLCAKSGHWSTDYSITFVGTAKQRWRHGEAECFGSLEVDDQLETGRRLDRKIGRLLAFEDAIDIPSRASVRVEIVRPVRHQAAISGFVTVSVDCGQL